MAKRVSFYVKKKVRRRVKFMKDGREVSFMANVPSKRRKKLTFYTTKKRRRRE